MKTVQKIKEVKTEEVISGNDNHSGCGTKLTGVQVHQIMPDTRRG
jgi:hypothetical protein